MEFGQDLGGVPLRSDGVPHSFDFAVRVDEKAAANNSQKRLSQKFLHPPRAVGFDCFQVWIAEEIEVELVLRFEAGLGFDGVTAQADDDRVELVEMFLRVAKLGRFDGSTGGVGFGKEKEDDAMTAEVGQRDVGARVVFQAKGRGLVTGFEHEETSVSPCGDEIKSTPEAKQKPRRSK